MSESSEFGFARNQSSKRPGESTILTMRVIEFRRQRRGFFFESVAFGQLLFDSKILSNHLWRPLRRMLHSMTHSMANNPD